MPLHARLRSGLYVSRAAPTAALVVIIAIGACTAGGATGARETISPRVLLNRLLTTAIKSRELPSGYYSAKVGVTTPSAQAKKHHVVGDVEIDFDSGDASVIYVVLPTRKDALGDWYDSDIFKKAKSRLPAPPNLPKPSGIFNTSVSGKNAFGKKVTNGVTIVGFVSQNVIVSAVTISTDNTESGDVPSAITLARFALRHLSALRVR